MGDGPLQLHTSNACFKAIYLRRNTKLAAAATLDLLCHTGGETTFSFQFSSNSATSILISRHYPLFLFSQVLFGWLRWTNVKLISMAHSRIEIDQEVPFHSFIDGDYSPCAGAVAVAVAAPQDLVTRTGIPSTPVCAPTLRRAVVNSTFLSDIPDQMTPLHFRHRHRHL